MFPAHTLREGVGQRMSNADDFYHKKCNNVNSIAGYTAKICLELDLFCLVCWSFREKINNSETGETDTK